MVVERLRISLILLIAISSHVHLFSCADGRTEYSRISLPALFTGPNTIIYDGFHIVGKYPIAWTKWTLDDERKWILENTDNKTGSRSALLNNPNLIKEFIVSYNGGPVGDPDKKTCAVLIVTKLKCGKYPCMSKSKKFRMIRPGLWSQKIVHKDDMHGLRYQRGFWVRYTGKGWGSIIECSGFDRCGEKSTVWDRMYQRCLGLKVTRL